MDIYTINLTILLALCGILFLFTNKNKSSPSKSSSTSSPSLLPFYTVYTLVMASDWLQGPFLYSLYRDEHLLPPSQIPTLFTTGFLSGAASGTIIGFYADKYGRKKACLLFCPIYALSCILTTIPSLTTLFLGRILGGIGTSLLFSVFESWLVADLKSKKISDEQLSKTFGVMSTLNSLVAIASGVISEWLVTYTETKKSPFLLSAFLLLPATIIISTTWKENYAPSSPSTSTSSSSTPTPSLLSLLRSSPPLLSLTLTTTLFESSIYLFVFFWSPTLLSLSSSPLPFGIIFSSFMTSTLFSSLLFPLLTQYKSQYLLILLLTFSSILYLLSAYPITQQLTFWTFSALEACIGLYFPTISVIKNKIVDDSVRAKVYGFLRIPLNIFVVAALVLTRDSGENGFQKVFMVCSGLLMVAAGVVGVTKMDEKKEHKE
ncbi:major facilitator superfamily transporter [Podospora fimiseda]|uniref:Molybdate-anion transporter n=1 Tax=Podospora fimiseda TaxID=252190 RepID=A0AAN7BZL5_9PEZI|nr:major facilitator superfamily transporter [Podospora fimiseda]